MKLFRLLLVLLQYNWNCGFIAAQNPQFVRTRSRLPFTIRDNTLAYDGDDSIYLIGGVGSIVFQEDVVRYSISSDSVENLGKFIRARFGSAVTDGEVIIHFGGLVHSEIYRYNVSNGTYHIVNYLPHVMIEMGSASDWEKIYLVGGRYNEDTYDTVLQYNIATNQLIQIGSLPNRTFGASAVLANEQIYIFGGWVGGWTTITPDILKFDARAQTVIKLATKLPQATATSYGFYNGRDVYVKSTSFIPYLYKFDPTINQIEQIFIESWPLYLDSASYVYVPKFSRIYLIGGYGRDEGTQNSILNHISYIQLPIDVEPTTTTTLTSAPTSTAEPTTGQAPIEDCRDGITTLIPNPFCPDPGDEDEDGSSVVLLSIVVSASIVTFAVVGYVCIGRCGVVDFHGIFHIDTQATRRINERTLPGVSVDEVREGAPEPLHESGELHEEMYFHEGNISCLPYNRLLEIPKDQILVDESTILGRGQFGVVLKGTVIATGKTVAVKTTQPGISNNNNLCIQSLLGEIKILSYVGQHDNIVNLIGAQTTRQQEGIGFMLVEYCALGDLENYLRRCKDSFGPTTSQKGTYLQVHQICPDIDQISTSDLLLWSTQSASAMEFLVGKKVIHGDLATRNVLLFAKDRAKLTDFGLSKRLYSYTSRTIVEEMPLPWQHMAIESLRQMKFSPRSDVWSFGVTLWEIFSLGDVPYTAATQFSMDFVVRLEEGYRLPNPGFAPAAVYPVLLSCWNSFEYDRPDFTELKLKFQEIWQQCLT